MSGGVGGLEVNIFFERSDGIGKLDRRVEGHPQGQVRGGESRIEFHGAGKMADRGVPLRLLARQFAENVFGVGVLRIERQFSFEFLRRVGDGGGRRRLGKKYAAEAVVDADETWMRSEDFAVFDGGVG